MKAEKLVHMANQIATFFASRPQAEAADGVAAHINAYWDPRMRRALLEIGAGPEADRLSPVARAALAGVRRPDPARFAAPATGSDRGTTGAATGSGRA